MKRLVIILGILSIYSSSVLADELPYNAIRKGSLSNQKLMIDAKIGVVSKVATLGCKEPESFLAYVLALPQGEIGSRYWQEVWVVKGCNSEYPVRIRFSEVGLSGANWTVEN